MSTPPPAKASIKPNSQQMARDKYRADLEELILGAVLLEQNAYARVAHILRSGTFIGKHLFIANSEVWRSIEQVAIYTHVDIITVTYDLFRRLSDIPTNPICEYPNIALQMSSYTNRVASSANLESHCILLFEFALREQAVSILRESECVETEDFFRLSEILSDETRDIHHDIHTCVAFLRQYDQTDAADMMQEYCANVSIRLKKMTQVVWRNYIKQQYDNIIKEEDEKY